MAKSGDISDCHDRGEGLLVSGSWRLGMLLRSLQSTGTCSGHAGSTCQDREMTHSVSSCFICLRTPRTRGKMASVGAAKTMCSLAVLI